MECSKEELIRHALYAVKESLQEEELSSANCGVAIVGVNDDFVILDPKSLQEYIDSLEGGKDEQQTKVDTEDEGRSPAVIQRQDISGRGGIGVGGAEGPTDMETWRTVHYIEKLQPWGGEEAGGNLLVAKKRWVCITYIFLSKADRVF